MPNSKLAVKYYLPPPLEWTLVRVMQLSQEKGGGYKEIRNKKSAKGPVFIATKFYNKMKLLPQDKPAVWTKLVPRVFTPSAPPQNDENQDEVLRRQMRAIPVLPSAPPLEETVSETLRVSMRPVLVSFTPDVKVPIQPDAVLVAVQPSQRVAVPTASIPGTFVPDVSSVAAVLVCSRLQSPYRKAHKARHRKQRRMFKANEAALVEHLKAKEAAKVVKLALLIKQRSAQQAQIEKNSGVASSTFARGRKQRADRGYSFFKQNDWDLAKILEENSIERKQESDRVCDAARAQRQSVTKQRKSAKNALKREKELELCEREDLDQRLRTMRAKEEFLRRQLLEDYAKECLHAVALATKTEADKTFQLQQQAHAELLRSERARAEIGREVLLDKLRIAVTLRTVVHPQLNHAFWQGACVRAIKENSDDFNDKVCLWEAVQEYHTFAKVISQRNSTDFQPIQEGEYCEALSVRQACKSVIQRAFRVSSSAPYVLVSGFVLSLVQEMECYLHSVLSTMQSFEPAKSQTYLGTSACYTSVSACKVRNALPESYTGLLQGCGKGTVTRAQGTRSSGRLAAATVSDIPIASTPIRSNLPATRAEITKRAAALKSVRAKSTVSVRQSPRKVSEPKSASLPKPPDKLKSITRRGGDDYLATSDLESEDVQEIVLTDESAGDSSADSRSEERR